MTLKLFKNSLLVLLLIFILAGCTSNKQVDMKEINNKPVTLMIPIYSQKISLSLPDISWKPVFENNNSMNYRIEFISKKEKVEDWNMLVSIQGFKDLITKAPRNNKVLPLGQASYLLKKSYQKLCPQNKFVYEVINNITDKKDRRIDILMGCTVATNIKTNKVKHSKGELGYYIFIAGEKDLYIVHKAIRGPEKDIVNNLNKQTAKEFISNIEPINLI